MSTNIPNNTCETALNKAGSPWTKQEDDLLVKLYNVDKLNVGEIAKIHGRAVGGILARLVKNKIIPNKILARGYNLIKTNDNPITTQQLLSTPNVDDTIENKQYQIITINDIEYFLQDNKVYTINKVLGELYGYYSIESNTITTSQKSLKKIINWISGELDKLKSLKVQYYGIGFDIVQDYFKTNKLFKIFNGQINKTESVNTCICYKYLVGDSWLDQLEQAIELLPFYGNLIVFDSIENFQAIKEYVEIRGLTIESNDFNPSNKLFFFTAIKNPSNINGNIMFLDTETIGFPTSSNPKDIDKYNKARLIELGYLIYGKDKCKIKEVSSLVKPVNFTIGNTFVHGITTSQAQTNGLDINIVLTQLYEDLKNTDTIICHNINFDMQILLSEAHRAGNIQLYNLIESKNKLCTMDLGKKYMKSTKQPKLVELYKYLFDKEIKQDHRSLSDCIICADCYYKMI